VQLRFESGTPCQSYPKKLSEKVIRKSYPKELSAVRPTGQVTWLRTMKWGFEFSTADQVFFASSNGKETSLRSSEWPFDPAREDHAREADWRGTPLLRNSSGIVTRRVRHGFLGFSQAKLEPRRLHQVMGSRVGSRRPTVNRKGKPHRRFESCPISSVRL
jgi:hypothetical protein